MAGRRWGLLGVDVYLWCRNGVLTIKNGCGKKQKMEVDPVRKSSTTFNTARIILKSDTAAEQQSIISNRVNKIL
jgi:hypothetical protein